MSITPLETRTTPDADTVQDELRTLCSHFLVADDWGRARIMAAARTQAEKHPAKSPRSLHLVASAGLDQKLHFLDDVVNGFPLTIVR